MTFPRFDLPKRMACGIAATLLASLAACHQPVQEDRAPPSPNNTVSASLSQDGEVLAFVGTSTSITLTFSSSGDGAASDLALHLASLPEGWRSLSSGSTFHCREVSEDAACQLSLQYQPRAATPSSSLALSYIYLDSAGKSRFGNVTIAYRAQAANAVIGTWIPAGPLAGIVGARTPAVLNFTTVDGNPATGLQVTTVLSTLPDGWRSDDETLACPVLGSGPGCQLRLSYEPREAARNGRLDIAYAYTDSAGKPQSGTASLAYSATTHDSVVAEVNPPGPLLVKPLQSRKVTVRFQSSDGASASGLRITSGLPSRNSGWTMDPQWPGCARIGHDANCVLTLNYAPHAVAGPAVLALGYAYTDSHGRARSGVVDISYSSLKYEAYVAGSGGIWQCALEVDGSLSNCARAGVALPSSGLSMNRIRASGRRAYIASAAYTGGSSISVCAIAADGALRNCEETGEIAGVRDFKLRGSAAYIVTGAGEIIQCGVDADGRLSPCRKAGGLSSPGGELIAANAITFVGSTAYVSTAHKQSVLSCKVNTDETLDCAVEVFKQQYFTVNSLGSQDNQPVSWLYMAAGASLLSAEKQSVGKCDVFTDSFVNGCNTFAVATLPFPTDPGTSADLHDIAIDSMRAYLVRNDFVFLCAINSDTGYLIDCKNAGSTGATLNAGISINRVD